MHPDYNLNNILLFKGDCLDVMPTFDKNSIDMILCDLPYGTTRNPWDVIIPFELLWKMFNYICKGPIVLFASQPFTSQLIMSNLKNFRYEWIWEKNKATGHFNAKNRPMLAHETVVVFGNVTSYNPQMTEGHKPMNAYTQSSKSSCYGDTKRPSGGGSTLRYPRSIQKFNVVNNDDPEKFHPNQKPVPFLEYLILSYSMENAIIFDATMGVGSTGVASINTNRNFIGIEKDDHYFQIAKKRIHITSMEKEIIDFL